MWKIRQIIIAESESLMFVGFLFCLAKSHTHFGEVGCIDKMLNSSNEKTFALVCLCILSACTHWEKCSLKWLNTWNEFHAIESNLDRFQSCRFFIYFYLTSVRARSFSLSLCASLYRSLYWHTCSQVTYQHFCQKNNNYNNMNKTKTCHLVERSRTK